MGRKAMVTTVTALGLAVIVVAGGALGLYYYTLPPVVGTPSGVRTSTATTFVYTAGPDGRNYTTVEFNGSSYQMAQRLPNDPQFSCPAGTAPALCNLLEASCGNGISGSSEPWKNCFNCGFDDACTGQQTCDPYNHQCAALVSACMVAAYGPGNG